MNKFIYVNDFNFFFLFYNMLIYLLLLIIMVPSNLYSFHPMTLTLLLIIYILLMSVKMNFLGGIYWYSYILFLVMVGGMMILFMYFTSLNNNQLFYFNYNYFIYMGVKFVFLIIYLYVIFNYYNINFFNIIESGSESDSMIYLMMKLNSYYKNLMMDYCLDLSIYIIMYLFFTMMCSIFICSKIMIPLRQMLK